MVEASGPEMEIPKDSDEMEEENKYERRDS